jgi:hypothetical protein
MTSRPRIIFAAIVLASLTTATAASQAADGSGVIRANHVRRMITDPFNSGHPIWSLMRTTRVVGAGTRELTAVSCSSANICTAVGHYLTKAGIDKALAERWNGSRWAVQRARGPAARRIADLSGISCTSAKACTAVGSYVNRPDNILTLVERWNGRRWAIRPSPNPPGGSDLWAVSCTSVKACAAVGGDLNPAGNEVTLAERWNGMRWTIEPTPKLSGVPIAELFGVSCTSPTACTAVGHQENPAASRSFTLAEQWNGKVWAIQPTSLGAGNRDGVLSGVSCWSATACTAVGDYTNRAGTVVTLAERWNGASWIMESTPNPRGARRSGLSGISCTSPLACTAVNRYTKHNGRVVTLAEAWRGTRWTIQPTPNPPGPRFSELVGVSCVSSTRCIAVGDHRKSVFLSAALAEHYSRPTRR